MWGEPCRHPVGNLWESAGKTAGTWRTTLRGVSGGLVAGWTVELVPWPEISEPVVIPGSPLLNARWRGRAVRVVMVIESGAATIRVRATGSG